MIEVAGVEVMIPVEPPPRHTTEEAAERWCLHQAVGRLFRETELLPPGYDTEGELQPWEGRGADPTRR